MLVPFPYVSNYRRFVAITKYSADSQMKGRLEKHETRKLWKTQGGRGREKVFYSGFNTCPSRGLKANTLRTAALSQNGGYIYIYIFIRARGYRSNLDSSEFKGCNSNVRGRVHLQAARRLFKVSSEMVEAQCVSCPCCAFRNKFCALCTRIWNRV